MLEWTQPFALPSAETILRTKAEIEVLEGALEEALIRVSMVQRALEEKRASIAPIRILNSDVLSLIFEFAAEMDWTSPVSIAIVSRLWRTTIIDTPRAWRFVDTCDVPPQNFELYCQRSPAAGLHIRDILSPTDLHHLALKAHKIECLTVYKLTQSADPVIFPNLRRLITLDGYHSHWGVDKLILFQSSFPSLRHLQLNVSFDHSYAISDFPPLETLAVAMYEDLTCLGLIEACKSSLKSLKMKMVYEFDYEEQRSICLPRLRYLEIRVENLLEYFWPIQFDTPVLETYIEQYVDDIYLGSMHEDIGSVQYLRLQSVSRPLERIQELRILQLNVEMTEIENLLEKEKGDESFFPNLRSLEFSHPYMQIEGVSIIEERVKEWSSSHLPGLVQPPALVTVWSTQLPGEDDFKCTYCPCADAR